MYKKISRDKFSQWLGRLRTMGEVFAPCKDNGLWAYREWKGQDLPEDFLNSRLSPKSLFLESPSPLFNWKSRGGSVEAAPSPSSPRPRVIYGIKACDARAVRILEPVFAGSLPDAFYLGNLARTLLLGISCQKQCPGSFCREMGIDPQDSTSCDIFFRDTTGGKVAKGITEKGKALIQESGLFEESSPEEWDSARKEIKGQGDKPLFDLEKVKDRMAGRFPEEELWKSVSAKCINCGVCTYLCPTCHCFDICDLEASGQGSRFRCFDSCAFPGFTKMAVHNPREEKWRRYRQRVGHKFYFYPRNFQMVACVGCGRCVSHCPVNLDLRGVLLEVAR